MNGNISLNAVKILRILESRGFQAYIVGGAVRDILMGRSPQDFDICTDALSSQMKEIFGSLGLKTVLVGEKYGTVQVCLNGEFFEVTTFRTDDEYIDSRHPESVSFSTDIADDLKRRDFTVNALACSVSKNGEVKIIDIFEGQPDIKNKIIRAVGDPRERFSEDALRMIRAVRFSAKLGFDIEPGTKSAILSLAEKINLVSMERISAEIEKILLSDNPEKFLDLSDLNLLKNIMPFLDEEIKRNKSDKINMLRFLEKDFCVRFAALFEIYGDNININELRGLRLKNFDVKNITNIFSAVKIIKSSNDCLQSKVFVKRILRGFGKSDINFASNITDTLYNIDMYGIINEIESNREPYKLSDLKINGDNIINITDEKPGKKIGGILSECLEYVIENPDKNNYAELVGFVKELLTTDKLLK